MKKYTETQKNAVIKKLKKSGAAVLAPIEQPFLNALTELYDLVGGVQAAKMLEVSKQYMQEIVKQGKTPSIKTIRKMAEKVKSL